MSKHHLIGIVFIALLTSLSVTSFFVAIPICLFVYTGLVWFFIALVFSALIASNYHLKAYCRNPDTQQKVVAITFDDGPTETTPLVLEVLAKHNAKATFFVIGKNIEQYPGIMKEIVAKGHTIGNHTYGHSPMFDFYNKEQMLAEINQTDKLIEQYTKQPTRYFRPPYGVTTPSMMRAIKTSQHQVIGWDTRSLDGALKSQEIILYKIKKTVKAGSIILLHDKSPHSVVVLEQLLVFLRDNGFRVVGLGELMGMG